MMVVIMTTFINTFHKYPINMILVPPASVQDDKLIVVKEEKCMGLRKHLDKKQLTIKFISEVGHLLGHKTVTKPWHL